MCVQETAILDSATFVDVIVVIFLPKVLLNMDEIVNSQECWCLFFGRQRDTVFKLVLDILESISKARKLPSAVKVALPEPSSHEHALVSQISSPFPRQP